MSRLCIDLRGETKMMRTPRAPPIRGACGRDLTAGSPIKSPEFVAMRCRFVALLSLILPLLALAGPAPAQERKNDVKGLFLLRDFPAVSVRPGQSSTINVRVQNYNMPPERMELKVSD